MGERSTNKAGQPLLPAGAMGGRQSTALTWPQKPPGSGHWLGLAAGTATLPSSLSPGVQASHEQGQRPGAVPPARGGPAGGRGCCTADGSSCWHPWWWRRLGAAARGRSRPRGRAPKQCARASAAGGCAPRCVRERGRYAWSCPRGGTVSPSTGEVGKDLLLKPPVQPVCWDLMMSPPPSGLTPASSQSSNNLRKLLGGGRRPSLCSHTRPQLPGLALTAS